jgi:CRISPR/Cas system-associated endonuclease Cas1
MRNTDSEGQIHSRSVSLTSDTHGLIATVDLVEGNAGVVSPVEYKKGSPRKTDDGPEAWPADRVQVGVQALILRDNGYRCDGFTVGKSGEVLRISDKEKKVQEVRINEISQVNVFGNVQFTAPALHGLCWAEKPIAHFSEGGWFYGLTTGLGLKNVFLRRDLTVICHAVGFDPFIGFFHQPRFGRPALALDLIEGFRPLVADSTVLTAINTRMVTPADFIRVGPAVALTPKGRKAFLRAYEQRMDALVTHPLFGYRVNYRRVLEVQTRLLARVATGELATYMGFETR